MKWCSNKGLLILISFILFFQNSYTQNLNLGFEEVHDSKPVSWHIRKTNNYVVELDQNDKRSGVYSITIASSEQFKIDCQNYHESFQPIVLRLSGNFAGKKIKLSGYLKAIDMSKNSLSGFFLRADPFTNYIGGFKRIDIKEDTDWKKYEIGITPKEDTFSISFGATLRGRGKIWIDDLELTINGRSIHLVEHIDKKKEDWFYNYFRADNYMTGNFYKKDNSKGRRNLDSALVYIKRSIQLAEKANIKRNLIPIYKTKSTICSIKFGHDDPRVLDALNNALNLSISLNDLYNELDLKAKISNFYNISGNYNKAIEISKNIIDRINELKKTNLDLYEKYKSENKALATTLYKSITKNYVSLNDSHNSNYYNKLFHRSLIDKVTDLSYNSWLKDYYINQGDIYLIESDYALAEKSYNRAFDIDLPPCYEIMQKAYLFAKIKFYQKEFKSAIALLEYGLAKDSNYKKNIKLYPDYFLYLARSYREVNDFNKASEYLEKHINVLVSSEKVNDTLKIKLKNQELKQFQLEINELKEKKETNKKYLIYGSSFTIILLVFLGVVSYSLERKRQRRFNDILKEMEEKKSTLENKKIRSITQTNLKEKTVTTILNGLKELEEQKYYLRKDCTINNVAKKLKTNTLYLSKVIALNYQTNFNSYINDFRINYVLLKLKKDAQFRLYTIQAISNELGYKSVNTFTKAFKQHTGMLPSYYIKKLNKL